MNKLVSVGAMNNKTFTMIAGATALLAGGTMSASAQQATQEDLKRGETVLERPRPELEPLGIRAGSFLIYPRIEAASVYDDNVFATENDTESDVLFQVRPDVTVQSDFNNHSLRFRTGAEIGRFVENSSENYADYFVTADGRVDILRDTNVTLQVAHRKDHEGRSDPDSSTENNPEEVNGRAEPVEYTQTGAVAAFNQRFNRVSARVSFGADYYSFQDVALRAGGTSDQSGRDRWEYDTIVQLGYDIQPGYQAFIRGTYNIVEYDRSTANRDSDGYEIVGGARFDLTNLITGEVFAGYLQRDYDLQQFSDFSGVAYGLDLAWSVTQLTTVRGLVSRTVEETTLLNASSRDRTLYSLGVDHELLRSVILSGRAQYRQDDFQGANRNDDYYTASIGATYALNRNFYLEGTYTYETRDSNVAGEDYDSNLVLLSVGAHF
jgi:hypothetical protein